MVLEGAHSKGSAYVTTPGVCREHQLQDPRAFNQGNQSLEHLQQQQQQPPQAGPPAGFQQQQFQPSMPAGFHQQHPQHMQPAAVDVQAAKWTGTTSRWVCKLPLQATGASPQVMQSAHHYKQPRFLRAIKVLARFWHQECHEGLMCVLMTSAVS
jgi:hypothetical protein